MRAATAKLIFENGHVTKQICFWRPTVRHYNRLLRPFYPGLFSFPLVAHEVRVLKALEPFNIAPRVLSHGNDLIKMTNVGLPYKPGQALKDKEARVTYILGSLMKAGVIHNDLLPQNLTVMDGLLYLVDFQLASIGDVSIVEEMTSLFERPNVKDEVLKTL